MLHRRLTLSARRRRIGLIVVVTLGALIAAASALAYWRTAGAGTGSGATASVQTITLSPGTPTAALYPGGQSDVALTVDNPNAVTLKIGSLSLSAAQGTGGFAVDSGHATCATAALSFTTQTNGGAGWSVPPRVGSTDGSLSIDLGSAVAMSTSAAGACQGASFTVYLTAGP
jgi:hypothetical protein